jgi:hypothetical protein
MTALAHDPIGIALRVATAIESAGPYLAQWAERLRCADLLSRAEHDAAAMGA